MTIPVSNRLSQLYVGNGVNTRFDFTFRAFGQEDETGIAVRVKDSNGFEFIDSDLYSVNVNQDGVGGYITFTNPPSASTYFYIIGNTSVDQLLDITNYDNFYPDAIERALDKITAILQERNSLLDLEVQARTLADINYDLLAQARETDLKNYIDTIVANITDAPLAESQFVTYVDSVSDLPTLLKWDGRVVYVKNISHFEYKESSDAWILKITPISAGGTGSTTEEGARTNLSVPSVMEMNTAIASATPNATETIAGKAKIATTAIAQSGTNDTDIVTPKKLRDSLNATGSAPIYACRAWVKFNATSGTPTIGASGNVSSITDNGIGNYTVNCNLAMHDLNFAASALVLRSSNGFVYETARTTSSISLATKQDDASSFDCEMSVILVR